MFMYSQPGKCIHLTQSDKVSIFMKQLLYKPTGEC